MTKDRLKEEIGLYKLLMTILSLLFTSIVSWMWNDNIVLEIKILFYLGAILSLILNIFLFFKIDSKIKELDHYEH